MNNVTEKPEQSRVTLYRKPAGFLLPKSEMAARKNYFVGGPRAGFFEFYGRAKEGSSVAQAVLGNMYLNGFVDDKCMPSDAACWAKQSAEAGNAYGQWVLAWSYLEQDLLGDGFAALYESADRDFGPALYHLGLYLSTGVGVSKDEQRGIAMLIRAADLGHRSSKWMVDFLRKKGQFGLATQVVARVTSPFVKIGRGLFWLFFSAKFGPNDLVYYRSIHVENDIRRKPPGSVSRQLEGSLDRVIAENTK